MLHNSKNHSIFVTVFHRILDFKAGLDFYLGPFFLRPRQIPQRVLIRLDHFDGSLFVQQYLSF